MHTNPVTAVEMQWRSSVTSNVRNTCDYCPSSRLCRSKWELSVQWQAGRVCVRFCVSLCTANALDFIPAAFHSNMYKLLYSICYSRKCICNPYVLSLAITLVIWLYSKFICFSNNLVFYLFLGRMIRMESRQTSYPWPSIGCQVSVQRLTTVRHVSCGGVIDLTQKRSNASVFQQYRPFLITFYSMRFCPKRFSL